MHGVAEIEFSGDSGLSDEVKSSDPLYLFELIFTEELCESIAEMTNLYAEPFVEKNKGHLSSRVKKWKKVTSSEMKLFLGFILYQGMIWKPTYEHYFTTNLVFSTPGVKNVTGVRTTKCRLNIFCDCNPNIQNLAYKCLWGVLPLGMHTLEQFLSIVHTSDIIIYTPTFL